MARASDFQSDDEGSTPFSRSNYNRPAKFSWDERSLRTAEVVGSTPTAGSTRT